MALRWRVDGRLICAAKCEAEPGDTYIDDRLHYQLSAISMAVIPSGDEAETGVWFWSNSRTVTVQHEVYIGGFRVEAGTYELRRTREKSEPDF